MVYQFRVCKRAVKNEPKNPGPISAHSHATCTGKPQLLEFATRPHEESSTFINEWERQGSGMMECVRRIHSELTATQHKATVEVCRRPSRRTPENCVLQCRPNYQVITLHPQLPDRAEAHVYIRVLRLGNRMELCVASKAR
ncbi:hypothetical protein PR048_015913 [Dryococelus australis]|uniref:Uncharacterized protein n=1 Tax=Dryococelus australis TaxID=614101 RepID=A0ABQ9HI90_9NEOP|nr:hypothetical protein PR048_015913 [Dryococelus australis]